uniref:Uncharacterized protein n=1 Tax=Cacopsylla melanoneura TaxID=428564 RepID=A0A8D9F9U1_9HEMI
MILCFETVTRCSSTLGVIGSTSNRRKNREITMPRQKRKSAAARKIKSRGKKTKNAPTRRRTLTMAVFSLQPSSSVIWTRAIYWRLCANRQTVASRHCLAGTIPLRMNLPLPLGMTRRLILLMRCWTKLTSRP